MTVQISVEADSKQREMYVLRVSSRSEAVTFSGKQVWARAVGGEHRELLWVRTEAGLNGGSLSSLTYHALLGEEPTGDRIELQGLSVRQRLARYLRLEVIMALLAVVVAVAVVLQPSADRELGRLDAVAQIKTAAAPVATALSMGNVPNARSADGQLSKVIVRNSSTSTGSATDLAEIIVGFVGTVVIAGLGLWVAWRRTNQPPWKLSVKYLPPPAIYRMDTRTHLRQITYVKSASDGHANLQKCSLLPMSGTFAPWLFPASFTVGGALYLQGFVQPGHLCVD